MGKIERKRIGDLRPDPENARRHPERNLAAIRASLERFRQQKPIVVTPEGLVVAGNGTLEAAKALGWEEIDVVVTKLPPKEWKAFALADNRTSELAEWDFEALAEALADVGDLGIDFELDGLPGETAAGEPVDAEPQIDRADELREKWGVKTGQLWRLGDHRLLCGDCTKREDVERLMGGELAALVATDPPYGVDYAAIVMSRVNQKAGGWSAIKSDGLDEDAEVVLRRAMVVAREFCGAGCAVLVWHPSGERAAAFSAALREAGVHVLKQIIWVKPTLVFGRHEYHWRHEPAMYGWFEGSRANFFGERSETTVWEIAPSEQFKVRNGPAMKSGGLGLHPTQKPVELFCRPLRNHTRSGDVALEPFAGSGSQIIAAEQLGRRCFAIEIEPKYVAVCIQRWADATGKVPELVDG